MQAETGAKRQREEETASVGADASTNPSPKRVRTEWNGSPSEALLKKQEEVDSIKTDEDATKFFEQMSDLLKMVSSDEGQELFTSEISDTLDQILKGYGAPPDLTDAHELSSFSGSGDGGLAPSSPSQLPTIDEFEFFDFSSFGGIEEDVGSKAPTPDLVQASSTNPSPGSGSETDGGGHAGSDTAKIADPKGEDLGDESDPLRLGFWREIDGGESAYYQASDNWKWDTPMPASEQPWAVFGS